MLEPAQCEPMSHLLNVILQRYSYPKALTTKWFEMKLQFTIIALALISVATQPIYAQIDEIDVGFEWDSKDCIESNIVTPEGQFEKLDCSWIRAITLTDKDLPETDEPDTPIAPMPLADQGTPITSSTTEPKTAMEIKIAQLEKKAERDDLKPSEVQVLAALKSFQKDCELGTEQGAPIQNYELFLVSTWEPYVFTDLSVNYVLKQIEIAIQKCKAQDIMKHKVLGAQYLDLPGKDDVKELWKPTAVLPQEAIDAYASAKMHAYWLQKSIDNAIGFQCSIEGKQQGHCPQQIGDQPPPKPTISKEGKMIQQKIKLYLESGVTDIPVQEQMKEMSPIDIIKQYMKAYNVTASDLEDEQ